MAIASSVLDNLPPDLPHHDLLDHCETEVVRLTMANLTTFPWIADAVAAGTLELHGFRFDIHSGVLARLEDGGFAPVETDKP
jgi:carbonic anhydrase